MEDETMTTDYGSATHAKRIDNVHRAEWLVEQWKEILDTSESWDWRCRDSGGMENTMQTPQDITVSSKGPSESSTYQNPELCHVCLAIHDHVEGVCSKD